MPDAGARLPERGAGSPLLGAFYSLHERGLALIRRISPAPESAMVAGRLLGDESDLTEAAQENLHRTGNAHITAISVFTYLICSSQS